MGIKTRRKFIKRVLTTGAGLAITPTMGFTIDGIKSKYRGTIISPSISSESLNGGEDPFIDLFDRSHGPLGNGWTAGHTWNPSMYEPIDIFNGSVVCADPLARGNHGIKYEPNQFAKHVPGPEGYASGLAHIGIGCAWREMGTTSIRCKVRWSGLHDIKSGHHVEAAPLIHITLGITEHGLGVWPASYVSGGPGPDYSVDEPLLFYGTIGSPPERFRVIDGALFTHTDGTPRDIEMVSDGEGARVYLDGEQVSFDTAKLNPLPIPETLKGSTLHGFAVDTHFAFPYEKIPTLPIIHQIEMRGL